MLYNYKIMIIESRYKDLRNSPGVNVVSIPISQWEIDGMLRIYTLIPTNLKDSQVCEVHILIEEYEEWKVLDDNSFSNGFLDLSSISNLSGETEQDLYFVWDDGIEEHLDRAKRLYQTFSVLIGASEATAKSTLERIADDVYSRDLKEAERNHWDKALIPRPLVEGSFGRVRSDS